MTNIIMTGTEVFKRTATYEREATSLRLHAPQWKLLLSFDGQRTLSDIAMTTGTPISDALTETEHFLQKDWIAEQPISLEEYLKRAGSSSSLSSPSAPTPPPVVPEVPKAETPRVETKPVEPKIENGATASHAPVTVMPAAAAATATTTTARDVVATPVHDDTPSPRGPMRLSAIVDYIVSLAESVPLGQLLAYRIFLRVPPEILQSEEIVSIHLVDDTSIIRTAALQKAIANAVNEITKRTLPDSVYATA